MVLACGAVVCAGTTSLPCPWTLWQLAPTTMPRCLKSPPRRHTSAPCVAPSSAAWTSPKRSSSTLRYARLLPAQAVIYGTFELPW